METVVETRVETVVETEAETVVETRAQASHFQLHHLYIASRHRLYMEKHWGPSAPRQASHFQLHRLYMASLLHME